MKLIYIDPQCSGLQVVKCTDIGDVGEILKKQGIDEDSYGGEVIHCVFINDYGDVEHLQFDFT